MAVTATTWAQFNRSHDRETVFLLDIQIAEAANPANTKTLHLATAPRAFGAYYYPVVKGVSRLKASLQSAFSGKSAMTWGTVTLRREAGYALTPDRTITADSLLSGAWVLQGRTITIRIGGDALPESEYQIIFRGTCGRLKNWTATSFELDIVAGQAALKSIIINPNTIASGLNVPDSSVGRVKPVALGNCRNVQPILINDSTQTYFFHDTTTVGYSGLAAVYDDGADITANATDNGDGTFTLSVSPVGTVTCDIAGAVFGDPAAYQDDIAGISDGLLRAFAEYTDDDIDTDSVTACATALPYEVGLYSSDKTSLLDALDQLASGIPCFHTFSRTGIFSIAEFSAPAATPDLTITDMICADVKGAVYDTLLYSQPVLYDRNRTVINENQAAASISQDLKSWLAEEWRTTEYRDTAIKTVFPLATEGAALETCLINKADADAVAAKWIALMGTWRRTYTMTITPLSLDYSLHQTALFKCPSFGLSAGFLCRVIEITEDYATRKSSLTLWG